MVVILNIIYYTMVKTEKSQGNEKQGGESPLNELLERAGVTTPEELAVLISVKSGEKISASTLRRRYNEGIKGWRSLGLSLIQWDAVAEICKTPLDKLPR